MSTLSREAVVKRIKSFNSRSIIDGAGKYESIRVNNIHLHEGKYIVNLHAHLSTDKELGLAELKDGKFDDFTNHNLTASVWEDAKYIPMESELVNIVVGNVYSKKQEKNVLGVISIMPMPAKQARVESMDLSQFDNLLDALPSEASALESARPEVG